MRVTAILLLIFTGITTNINGQINDTVIDNDLIIVPEDNGYQNEIISDTDNLKKLKPGLEVGTSFSFSPDNYYGPSYYVAPHSSFLVTPRFILTAGLAYEYSQIYPLYSGENDDMEMLPMTRAFLYARGTYLLSSRLTIGATAYKAINDVPKLTRNLEEMSNNYQGMSLDMQYKISDSFSVGFQIRMQNGSYYYNGNSMIPAAGYVPLRGF
ncbi:MAG: hypothetical protein JW894_16125 [Bacteroidales bacterium]|nr:hypothetical protein [Bacteroidales bacterium]